jgi:hypothetical protein
VVSQAVDSYSFFVCLLLGCSIGAVLCGGSFVFGKTAMTLLLAGWLLYFFWHLGLTFAVRRYLTLTLRGLAARIQPGLRHDSKDPSKPYSGVHRLFYPPLR